MSRAREALRQQLLLRALWRDDPAAVVAAWLGDGAGVERGLQAHRANAGALATRALAGAFPTVAALVGDASFAALARAFWHARPPARGDVGEWGDALPAFIDADRQLASEPYLGDVARLDWAVHAAAGAADAEAGRAAVERLGDTDPAALRIRLQPGTAVVASRHPIVAVCRAHHAPAADGDDRFAAARAALAAGRGENALVRRDGWRVDVDALPAPDARFVGALLGGASLADALDDAGAGFGFEAWLHAALRAGAIAGVDVIPSDGTR